MNYVTSHFFCSPAGWDNEKKVAILYENMHSVNPDHYYTDVIARPMIRKVVYRFGFLVNAQMIHR